MSERIKQLFNIAQKIEFVSKHQSLKEYLKRYYGFEEVPDDTVGWCSIFLRKVLPDVEIYIDDLAKQTAKSLKVMGLYSEETFFEYMINALNIVLMHELIHYYGNTKDEEVVEELLDDVTRWLVDEASMVWSQISCPKVSGFVSWPSCLSCNDFDKHPDCPLQKIRLDNYPRQYEVGFYHVSELIKPRYSFYERLHPRQNSWDEFWDMFFGKAIGWYVEGQYPKGQQEFEFDVPLNKLVEFLKLDPDPTDNEIRILGHADVVDTEQGLLLELKCMHNLTYVAEAPKPEHVFQLQAYWLLGNVQFPEEFSKFREARVVYFGRVKQGKAKRYIEHKVSLSYPDLVTPARALHKALLENRPPSTQCESWLCKFCESVNLCKEDEELEAAMK